MRLFAFALVVSLLAPAAAMAGDLTVTVDEIQSSQGSILGLLYDRDSSFLNPTLARAKFKMKAVQGQIQYVFHDLPAGKYALSTIQDTNDNGKLDRSSVGAPSEPYGFSNDAEGVGGPPKFGQAAFDFDGKAKSITVSLN